MSYQKRSGSGVAFMLLVGAITALVACGGDQSQTDPASQDVSASAAAAVSKTPMTAPGAVTWQSGRLEDSYAKLHGLAKDLCTTPGHAAKSDVMRFGDLRMDYLELSERAPGHPPVPPTPERLGITC